MAQPYSTQKARSAIRDTNADMVVNANGITIVTRIPARVVCPDGFVRHVPADQREEYAQMQKKGSEVTFEVSPREILGGLGTDWRIVAHIQEYRTVKGKNGAPSQRVPCKPKQRTVDAWTYHSDILKAMLKLPGTAALLEEARQSLVVEADAPAPVSA